MVLNCNNSSLNTFGFSSVLYLQPWRLNLAYDDSFHELARRMMHRGESSE